MKITQDAFKAGFQAGKNGFPGTATWNQYHGKFASHRYSWYLGWEKATGKQSNLKNEFSEEV